MKRIGVPLTIAVSVVWFGFAAAPAGATQPGSNGRIAFTGDTGNGVEIFTINPDGSDLQQLTHLGETASTPDFSPDGARIVFALEDVGIFMMDADGSNQQQLTVGEGPASFTPDGHHLVYECGDCTGGDGVFLMRDDASDFPGLRLSTNPFPDEGDGNPEVSPDGQTVTFVRHQVDGELQALFAVDIDGSNTRQLTPYGFEVGIKHDWAPDGQRIVVTPWADFPDHLSPDVATIAADGSDVRMLTMFTAGGAAAFAGSYSPDGAWIAFRQQNKVHSGLWVMHPDGTARHQIGSFAFRPRFIDWGSAS